MYNDSIDPVGNVRAKQKVTHKKQNSLTQRKQKQRKNIVPFLFHPQKERGDVDTEQHSSKIMDK